MATYSEMNFLFQNKDNRDLISQQLDQASLDNTKNIFKPIPNDVYVVYKGRQYGTEKIKNFLLNGNGQQRSGLYKHEDIGTNPYIKLLTDFNLPNGSLGAGLTIKPSDLVYLKDLGVFPLNRMAILRRFPEGCFVPENLEEMKIAPISVVVGWIKFDENFGRVTFNETWSTIDKRFDVLIKDMIQDKFGGINIGMTIPEPDFLQGVLWSYYKQMGLTEIDASVEEDYEWSLSSGSANTLPWGLNQIPTGDPNMLHEGPFKEPGKQNLLSKFNFTLSTTYEQKLIGDVDPGSAMLDILDNLYAMGTSNMKFYWGEASSIIMKARFATEDKANNLMQWWIFIHEVLTKIWDSLKELFSNASSSINNAIEDLKGGDYTKIKNMAINGVTTVAQTILASTVAMYRFHLRGSIELMVGGKMSSSPWYLTIGNPYSPWLATNHIIIESAEIETSNEMGFNDQPQWIKCSFTCSFSRSLGKQELMRMFNNSFKRTYSDKPELVWARSKQREDDVRKEYEEEQRQKIANKK